MADPRDAFVIHRLRAKPISYGVEIVHYVSEGEWMMSVTVNDVSMENDDERSRVAEDLRAAASLVERSGSQSRQP